MDQQISFWKIIKTDYLAFYFFMLFVVLVGTLGYIQLTKGLNFPDLGGPIVFALMGFGSFAGVIYRVRKIKSIFDDGIKTNGVINNVHAFRGRVKVAYLYEVNCQRLMGKNYLLRNGSTRDLAPGQNVIVIYHSENPKSAVIDSLYR